MEEITDVSVHESDLWPNEHITGINEIDYNPYQRGTLHINGHRIRIKGVKRDERTRRKSETKRPFRIDVDLNAKKEAIRLCEDYIDDLFEKNNALAEDKAIVIFYNNYIMPHEKKLNIKWNAEHSRHRRIKGANKNQETEVRDKVLELLLGENVFKYYNDVLTKKISKGSIVYRYELKDLRNILAVSQTVGEEKDRLKIDFEADIITEDIYLRKTRELGHDNLQPLDERIRELWSEHLENPWTIDLSDDSQTPSWTKGRKLCKAENAYCLFGTFSDLKDKRGNHTYYLKKKQPYRVGIDLSTSVLEYLYLGGRRSIEDIATILSSTEPYDSLAKAINKLENMKLISKSKKTYKVTPLGRTAYKDVVERCLKDVTDYKGIYDALKNTATSHGII